jgi:hypothetical protein
MVGLCQQWLVATKVGADMASFANEVCASLPWNLTWLASTQQLRKRVYFMSNDYLCSLFHFLKSRQLYDSFLALWPIRLRQQYIIDIYLSWKCI